MAKSDDGLERIAAIARRGAKRSPLYLWLRARHDAFATLLEETRPDWRALAAGFEAEGLGHGRPIKPGTARHCWWVVRRDVAKGREKRPQRPQPVVTILSPAPAAPVVAAAPERPPDLGDGMAELRRQMDQRSGRG